MSRQNTPLSDDQTHSGQVTITNEAPNQGPQGVFHGPVNIHHNHQPSTPSALTVRQRAELLDRQKRRYQELLDHALPHQVRLQLSLHTRPDAVDPAWRRMLLRGPRVSSQSVPPGTPVLELFDGQQGQLLVLGAPGAGKTTLIIELAQALTARALADGQTRIPVVVNVAAWRSGQTLRDWLAPTLRDLLGASKRFAGQLAASDDLLLLLDGLDEVAADHRAACAAAINAYLGERDLAPPLVVGCRSCEYADMGARLAIAGAVELEPLELAAIEQALAGVPAAQGVLAALRTDELLRELATTPLMINVLLLAHGGQEVPVVQAQNTEQRHMALWRAYVWRMFVQRKLLRWPSAQALRYQRWLANLLRQRNETNLLIDDLQPDVLQPEKLWWYGKINRLINVLVFGMVFGLVYGLVYERVVGMVGELVGGLVIGLVFGLIIGQVSATVDRWEHRRWSWMIYWQHLRSNQLHGLVIGLVYGLINGLIYGLAYGLINGIFGGLIIGLVIALVITMVGGLVIGLVSGRISATIERREQQHWSWRAYRQGLRRNLSIGLAIGLIIWLVFTLINGLISILLTGWGNEPISALVGALVIALSSGLSFGLAFGLIDGWAISDLPLRSTPMQGLHASMNNGLYSGLVLGLVMLFVIWLVYGLVHGFVIGPVGGLVMGSVGGLLGGLDAFVKHYTLRLVLSRAGLFPFRAVTFLDAMTERLLLERDGAFYRFRHLLLRDFIADLSDDDIARLAREIDGEWVRG